MNGDFPPSPPVEDSQPAAAGGGCASRDGAQWPPSSPAAVLVPGAAGLARRGERLDCWPHGTEPTAGWLLSRQPASGGEHSWNVSHSLHPSRPLFRCWVTHSLLQVLPGLGYAAGVLTEQQSQPQSHAGLQAGDGAQGKQAQQAAGSLARRQRSLAQEELGHGQQGSHCGAEEAADVNRHAG